MWCLSSQKTICQWGKKNKSTTTCIPVNKSKFTSGFKMGYRRPSQVVSRDALAFPPGINMHFKCVSCDHLCLDFVETLSSYLKYITFAGELQEWNGMKRINEGGCSFRTVEPISRLFTIPDKQQTGSYSFPIEDSMGAVWSCINFRIQCEHIGYLEIFELID